MRIRPAAFISDYYDYMVCMIWVCKSLTGLNFLFIQPTTNFGCIVNTSQTADKLEILPEHFFCLPCGLRLILPGIGVLLPVVHFSQFALNIKDLLKTKYRP